jgi:hypothetical protein
MSTPANEYGQNSPFLFHAHVGPSIFVCYFFTQIGRGNEHTNV